jgi:hypothetical protein
MKRCPGCKHWKKRLQPSNLCLECETKGVGYKSGLYNGHRSNRHSFHGQLEDVPEGFVVENPALPCPFHPYTGERAAWMRARAELGLPLVMVGDADFAGKNVTVVGCRNGTEED